MKQHERSKRDERSGGELPLKRKYRAPSTILGLSAAAFFGKGDTFAKRTLNAFAWMGGFALGFFLLDEAYHIKKAAQDKPLPSNTETANTFSRNDECEAVHTQIFTKKIEFAKKMEKSPHRSR